MVAHQKTGGFLCCLLMGPFYHFKPSPTTYCRCAIVGAIERKLKIVANYTKPITPTRLPPRLSLTERVEKHVNGMFFLGFIPLRLRINFSFSLPLSHYLSLSLPLSLSLSLSLLNCSISFGMIKQYTLPAVLPHCANVPKGLDVIFKSSRTHLNKDMQPIKVFHNN